MFMLGEVDFQRKQYDQAIKNFQRVMFRYTAEQATPDIKTWQAKAGFEAGRCAEVLIESAQAAKRAARIAEATKYYTYVVEKHPDNEMAAEAKKRLAVLAKL
jgi:TolA-binding protein